MGKSKELLFSALKNRKATCKFTSLCNLYSNASYTCTHTGGNYCGRYRKLSRVESIGAQPDPCLIEIPQ